MLLKLIDFFLILVFSLAKMKLFSFTIIIGLLTILSIVNADPCDDLEVIEDDDCAESDYGSYVKCVDELKQKRAKRQLECPYAKLYNPNVESVDPYIVPLNGNHAAATAPEVEEVHPIPIHSGVGGDDMYRTISVRDSDGNYKKYHAAMPAGSNITTIINLNNIINNTNVVNVPTNINSTNVNNIHIYQNKTSATGGQFGMGYTKEGPCCNAVEPKACRKSVHGRRCHHHRHKTCGSQCTAKTIHVQSRRRCEATGGCIRRRAHVPQPTPRCVQSDRWPYVSCGHHREFECDGCYDHYGYGYENYGYENDMDCTGCYDDGYDQGPLYRRGPVLRPYYYHEPPCEITGRCRGHYRTSHGYYGHDRIDPAWGPNGEDDEMDEDQYLTSKEVEDLLPFDEDEEGSTNVGDVDDSGDTDFGVDVRKCRVLNDIDNTYEIRNCTADDINVYSANPETNPIETSKKDRRGLDMKRSYSPYDYVRPRSMQKHSRKSGYHSSGRPNSIYMDEEPKVFKDKHGEFIKLDEADE